MSAQASQYYRPDIDGLRAVAVTAVLLFHAGFTIMPGGYVGVDVFFVISGFLITSIINREINQGNFSLIRFWERRVRRIAPPLIAVLLFTTVGAWFWLFPSELREYSLSLIAQSVFLSNIFFWTQSGYFATAAELKPLQHTWSLAIEEQFYVLFPIILLLFGTRFPVFRFLFLSAIALISLIISINWVLNSPEMAFYWLPARAWELLLGSIIVFIPALTLNKTVRQVLATCGLLMVILPCFFYDASTRFPGLSAVTPCLGTAFIIFAHKQTQQSWVYSMLSLKPIVFIGLISYSLYLWHWPLFAFARNWQTGDLPMETSVIIILLSIVLAIFSYYFIENPVRTRRVLASPVPLFVAAGIFFSAFMLAGTTGYTADGFPDRLDKSARKMLKGHRYGNPRRRECLFGDRRAFVPDEVCKVGDQERDEINFLVVGDSHANSIMPVVDRLAADRGLTGFYPVYNGCPPLLYIYRSDAGKKHQCHDFNSQVLDIIKENEIKHVLLVGRWTYYALDGVIDRTDDNGLRPSDWHKRPSAKVADMQRYVTDGLDKFIAALDPDVTVTLLKQVPEQARDISPRFLAKQMHFGTDVTKLGVSYADHMARQEFANSMIDEFTAKSDRISAIDLTPYLCTDQQCPVTRDGGSLYRDWNHISTYGTQFVEPAFTEFFDTIAAKNK